MDVLLFTSAFCAPCAAARRVMGEVARLVPAARIRELDVAAHPDEAEAWDIRSTPTAVVRDAAGTVVARATGVPRVDQVLVALARAV